MEESNLELVTRCWRIISSSQGWLYVDTTSPQYQTDRNFRRA